MSNLDDFIKAIAEGKQATIDNNPGLKALKELQESLRNTNPFASPVKEEVEPEPVVLSEDVVHQPVEEPTVADPLAEVVQHLNKEALSGFQQPNPDKVDPTFKAMQDKLKFLEQWIGKISAHGPGSGEVNLRWLDDIDRPTIQDGRYLKYNASTKKFEFDEINTNEVIYNTTYVTTPTYTVQDGDYYIGIDVTSPCTVTLPVTTTSGRTIIIKDEDGDAETNPITIVGTIDNDSGGAVLQINNGAIQLLFRNGWRIV